MGNPTVELSRKQIVNALVQCSPQELKSIFSDLFKQKTFAPQKLEDITRAAAKTVKQKGLKAQTVQEAVTWARSKR